MKRIVLLLLLALCLTGCGDTVDSGTQDALQSVSSSWGITVEEAASQSPKASPSLSPTPSPSPSPTPEPLPESLAELCQPGPSVLVDGKKVDSLLIAETTMVNAAELTELFPWFQRQDGTEHASFTRKNGETIEIDCLTVDGVEHMAEAYDGTGGIYFAGATIEYWLPIRWLSEQLGLKFLWDGDQAYVASPLDMEAIPQGVDVPILMYHAVSDNLWGIESLFVSPEDMRAQLEYLTENGYDPIFFSDLTHLSDYDKPILLTFDDGYDDNYEYLFPLLQEFGVKATVFVITGALGNEYYLTEEQVREMSESGLVDIQSHTVNHDELETLNYEEQAYQMSQSQLDIARITGKIPYVLSYPSGSRDDNTLELAPEYYSFGIDMNGGIWHIEGDYFQVDRIYVSRFDTLDEYIAMLP